MSQFLLGLALVSGSLQTAWALFAEGHFLALPLAAAALLFGSGCIGRGLLRSSRYLALRIEY